MFINIVGYPSHAAECAVQLYRQAMKRRLSKNLTIFVIQSTLQIRITSVTYWEHHAEYMHIEYVGCTPNSTGPEPMTQVPLRRPERDGFAFATPPTPGFCLIA